MISYDELRFSVYIWLALVAASALLGLSACQSSAIAVHARAATATAGTLAAAGDVVDEARRQALDRVEQEYPNDPEHDEQLLAEDARWRPVGAALDLARNAQLAWVSSIHAAYLAGADVDLLGSLAPVASRAIMLYMGVIRLAASLGAELPEPPGVVLQLATGFGGAE